MPLLDFIFRLLAATAAGGFVGLERQISNKSAGLRTNTLVAVGACIFTMISFLLTEKTGDPSRVIGQIVTGIGFLGAGVILHQGANVHGLTTAATIWCSAALGCLSGLGYFMETAVCTVLIILVNSAFKKADKWFTPHHDKEKDDDSRKNHQ